MTILVTGSTGLVGARLLPRLVEVGHEIRALMRADKAPSGSTAAQGDLLNAGALQQAMTGVSAIVHLAAIFRTRMSVSSGRAILRARAT